MKKKRKTYTAAQRKAYWIGVGMAIGKSQCKEDIKLIKESGVSKSCEAGFGAEMGRMPPSITVFSK